MFHLIFILSLFILPQKTFATPLRSTTFPPAQSCERLFIALKPSTDFIKDLLLPLDVKRRLFINVQSNSKFKVFLYLYFNKMETTYKDKFFEIVAGDLEYKLDDAPLKQEILDKQIQILSMMKPEQLTFDMENAFFRILHQVYDPNISKERLIEILDDSNSVIEKLTYSKI